MKLLTQCTILWLVLVLDWCTIIEAQNLTSSPSKENEELNSKSGIIADGLHQRSVGLDEKNYLWIKSTLAALRHLLDFVEQNVDQVNLDGVVGMAIMEGQFSVFLKRNLIIPAEFKEEIQSLSLFARKVIELAKPLLLAADPSYYEELETVFNKGFFKQNYDTRVTNSNLVYQHHTSDGFTEELSDDCLSQVQGTRLYNGHPCSVSSRCFNMMTSSGFHSYALTHQLLYLMFVESMDCEEQLAAIGRKSCLMYGRCHTLADLQEIICANIVDEMKRLEAHNFQDNSEDLFIEQVAFCGMMGFKDVCTVHWLELILSWQNSTGCYDLIFNNPFPHRRRRQKRYDVEMTGGCSAHKTSAAAAALTVCTRFLVEDAGHSIFDKVGQLM